MCKCSAVWKFKLSFSCVRYISNRGFLLFDFYFPYISFYFSISWRSDFTDKSDLTYSIELMCFTQSNVGRSVVTYFCNVLKKMFYIFSIYFKLVLKFTLKRQRKICLTLWKTTFMSKYTPKNKKFRLWIVTISTKNLPNASSKFESMID